MSLRDLFPDEIHWHSVWIAVAALALAGALVGAATLVFGLYNVSARAGHLSPVQWALHETYKKSVALHAPGDIAIPDLSDAGLIELGARHFDRACRFCHAAPGERRSATVRSMSPEPPHLVEAVSAWSAREMWWIVYEGIKMSGMPGWPSPREEEVWPVVAFLQAVQDELTATDYARLTAVPTGAAPGLGRCEGCHGKDGISSNPHVPRLDILSQQYMTQALLAYRRGLRDSGIMEQAVGEASEAELVEHAARLAAAGPAEDLASPAASDLAREGRALAMESGTRVPACIACHGPWPAALDPLFPSLAGQHAPYLGAQLRLWRDGNRGGGPASNLMHEAARELKDAEIEALAAWYASLAPATLAAAPE